MRKSLAHSRDRRAAGVAGPPRSVGAPGDRVREDRPRSRERLYRPSISQYLPPLPPGTKERGREEEKVQQCYALVAEASLPKGKVYS